MNPLAPWRAIQRSIDKTVLWPACKREAKLRGLGLDVARIAFSVHAFNDPAWLCLDKDEIERRIDRLV